MLAGRIKMTLAEAKAELAELKEKLNANKKALDEEYRVQARLLRALVRALEAQDIDNPTETER
jgi:hypothetical protein